MAKATIRTKLIEQLIAEGHTEVQPKRRTGSTPKYVTFDIPGQPGTFYFVGKAGALRKGRTSSGSASMEGIVRDRLVQRWDVAHDKAKGK